MCGYGQPFFCFQEMAQRRVRVQPGEEMDLNFEDFVAQSEMQHFRRQVNNS